MSSPKRRLKPSPAPWTFKEKPGRHEQWAVKSADGYSVVSSPGPDSGHPELDAQDLVNLRLIATLPKLLAELKRVKKILDQDGGQISCIGGSLRSKDLAKVISRAERA